MSETPSALNTALAEEVVPCGADGRFGEIGYLCLENGQHDRGCPAYHRPAVALALQSKDDSAALEIDRLKGEIARLRAALEPFVNLLNKVEAHYRKRGGNPDIFSDDRQSFDVKATEITNGQWRKARAALSKGTAP